MISARSPVTDSPWFWVYLFSTAALVALAIANPKYAVRQRQIERQFEGRQESVRAENRALADVVERTEPLRVGLRPLFFAMLAITMVGWILFWRTHLVRRRMA